MLRQLIKLLMRSGNKKGMNQLLKTHGSKITADDVKFAQNLPHKSKGVAGVKTLGNMNYKDLRAIEKGYTPNARLSPNMDALGRSKYATEWMKAKPFPGVTRYRKEQNLKDIIEDYNISRDFALNEKIGRHMPVNPLKARIRERVLQMRKDSGMARGLQRMESRKASALNTPGTPQKATWYSKAPRSGKALRYEPTVGRAANFTSLFAKDKGFRKFLRDEVGGSKMKDLSPKMRDDLAKRYISLKQRPWTSLTSVKPDLNKLTGR